MTDLFIYAIIVTLMSYAILTAYFDGKLFIGIRTKFQQLKNHSVITKNPLGYFLGYLFTCYFCSSYWVSWLVAFATYKIVFVEPLSALSSALVVFGTGLFSVAVLDIFNYYIIKEEIEFGTFFPWNDSSYKEVYYEDEEGQKIAAKFDDRIVEEAVSEPDVSDSVEDTIEDQPDEIVIDDDESPGESDKQESAE